MNKHYLSHAPDSVVRVIQTMNVDEIQDQYGIEIGEDGSVWDPLDHKEFDSVVEWATYMDDVEQQLVAASLYTGNCRYAFDDD